MGVRLVDDIAYLRDVIGRDPSPDRKFESALRGQLRIVQLSRAAGDHFRKGTDAMATWMETPAGRHIFGSQQGDQLIPAQPKCRLVDNADQVLEI